MTITSGAQGVTSAYKVHPKSAPFPDVNLFQTPSNSSSDTAYDEQLGITFSQSFSSIAYNVTAVEQQDPTTGYGPAYLLNGLSDQGYWYQVGLTWNWNPGNTPGTGFDMIFAVFNPSGSVIYPTNSQYLTNFNGPINQGDTVGLYLYFSSGNVVMLSKDLNTSAEAFVTYSDEGATTFAGLSQSGNSNGFFTGLMTEWYRPAPYYGNEQEVLYTDNTFKLTSCTMWMDEFSSQNSSVVFGTSSGLISYSNPTQLQEFSYNGATEYSDAYEFITGAVSLNQVSLTLSYSVQGGGTGYSPPVLTYISGGMTKTATLNISPTIFNVDSGSTWSVTPMLTGSTSNERWVINASLQADSGVISSAQAIGFAYYHQFLLSITGAGLSSQWYDSRATANVSIPGISDRVLGSGERVASYSIDGGSAIIVEPTKGAIAVSIVMDSPHKLSITSVQQYQVSLDAAISSALTSISSPTIRGDGHWYDQGTQVNLVLNGVWSRSGGTGQRLVSYSVNGVPRNVSTTGPIDVSLLGAISTPLAVSGTITTQYLLTTTTGQVASVTATSIAGDDGWYDSGTQVALTYNYSWNNPSGNSRYNALSYAVGGNETVLNRSGSGTFSVQVSMNAPETLTIASATQYSLAVSGGYGVSLSSASPTSDTFYDAGTTVTATTDYAWGFVNGNARQSLVSFSLDSSVTNITSESSGNFTTPNITFSGPHILVFNSAVQDLVAFQFKDSTGTRAIVPTSVQIQLEDPTIVSVPSTGVWLDSGTKFLIYDVEWEGVDVKPTGQTVYTVALPSNQTVLDQVYSGDIVAKDYLGLPVAGAHVSVALANGTTITSITGTNGSVALRDIPIGTFTAKIAYLGTTTSVNGNMSVNSSTPAKVIISYPTFVIVAVLLVAVVAVCLVAIRRRPHGQQAPPAPLGQPQGPVCKHCGSATEPGSPYCPNCGRVQT